MRDVLAAVIFCIALKGFGGLTVHARDDGRYANEPLHTWFDKLVSKKGLCCSFADGFSIKDVNWDTQEGHYRVRLYGEWVSSPTTPSSPSPTNSVLRSFGRTWTRTVRHGSDASSRERARRSFLDHSPQHRSK